MSLTEARSSLTSAPSTVRFVDSDIRSPYYYERFVNGATLVPRNLCFVKPESNPNSPAVISDPEANREAKKPWKGIQLKGVVDDNYIYATLLSKHLIPFGYEKLHMVALPAGMSNDGKLRMLEHEDDFARHGHFRSWDWFKTTAKKWDELKQATTTQSFTEQLNYRNKIISQEPQKISKVIYNASGTHLSACVFTANNQLEVYGRRVQGFVVDHKNYYDDSQSLQEAHYLCALLNSPSTDVAIKTYQTRGIFKGERDIHRTPFEACAIPPFDSTNADHLELARLSQEAHTVITALKESGGLSGSVYRIRDQARAAVADQLTAIDIIARRVLGL